MKQKIKQIILVPLLLIVLNSYSQDSIYVYRAETQKKSGTINELNFNLLDVWPIDVFHESHNFVLGSLDGVSQWIKNAYLIRQYGEIQTVFLSWGIDGGVNSVLTRFGEDEFLNYSILYNKLSTHPEYVTIRKDTLIIKEFRIVDDPFTYVDSCIYEDFLYFKEGVLEKIECYSKCPFYNKDVNPKYIQYYNYSFKENHYFVEVIVTDKNDVFQYRECFKYVVPEEYKMTKIEIMRLTIPTYIRWEFLPLLVENVKGIMEPYNSISE